MPHPIADAYPSLEQALRVLGSEFEQVAKRAQLPTEQYICIEGQACSGLALLISGSVRVYKIAESGRELTLYRLDPGESCILTASCILSGRAFPAFAITESEVHAYTVPAPTFQRWVARYPEWQRYVFDILSRRLETVIEVVEEVAFRRLDARLADYLLAVATSAGEPAVLRATHELIAADLGSSREVVSRLLKDFQREGLIDMARGEVRILDASGLGARTLRS